MKKTLIFAAAAVLAGVVASVVIRREPTDLASLSAPGVGSTNAPRAAAPSSDLAALQAKAAQGDARSQLELGKSAAQKMDYEGAARWYGAAMTNGSMEAAACLAELYQAGRGVPHDVPKAIKLYTEAAEKGNVTGQFDLGFLYEQGIGVLPSKTISAKWYRLASEGGDPTAQYDYGQRCFVGVGVPKDPVEGMKWLLIADRLGQPDAAGKLASWQQGMSPQDLAEARRRAEAFKPRPAQP